MECLKNCSGNNSNSSGGNSSGGNNSGGSGGGSGGSGGSGGGVGDRDFSRSIHHHRPKEEGCCQSADGFGSSHLRPSESSVSLCLSDFEKPPSYIYLSLSLSSSQFKNNLVRSNASR